MESEFLTLHESLSWARSRAGTPLPRRLQPRPLRSRPPSPTCASTSRHWGRGESRLPVCTLLWTELSKVRSLLYKITS